MEQTREALSEKEIKEVIAKIRNCSRFEESMITVARKDLEYGLTKSEIDIYLKEGFSLQQMKKLSQAIRRHGVDFAKTIAQEDLDEQCMQITIDFYEKGVTLEEIGQGVLQKTSAFNLSQIYTGMVNKIKDAENSKMQTTESVSREYLEQLFAEMKEIVIGINRSAEQYEKLNNQLREEEMKKQVQKEVRDANQQIQKQQETITMLENTITELQQKLAEKEEKIKEMNEKKQTVPTQIPVQYVATFPGVQNQPPVQAVIDRTQSKNTGMYTMLGKLAFKKKSKQDIVSLVASGDLTTQQLVQIRSAMEKGLTEEQLLELIHSNASPEQMKEIIEIAVLENSMN